MQSAQHKVQDFHLKYGYTVDKKLTDDKDEVSTEHLRIIAKRFEIVSKAIRDIALIQKYQGQDDRLIRIQLMMEEFAELVKATAESDIVETADALGDLLYTVLGFSVCYGFPLKEIFEEIHNSNMTKGGGDKEDKFYKSEEFKKPEIERVLKDAKYGL